LGGRRFADEEVEIEARKWLRKHSKDFYAAGFDALAKRWDECINVSGRYVEKYLCFPQVPISHVYVLNPFVTCLLALPHMCIL
jgi:hypothetical protein